MRGPRRVRVSRPALPSAADLRRGRDGVLRAVSLVVTDRRWAAPLSAMALGFGLFLGVAIGPGVQSTMATGGAPLLALVDPGEEQAAPGGVGAGAGPGGGGGEGAVEAWGGEADFDAAGASYLPAPPGPEPEPASAPQPAPAPRGDGGNGEGMEEAVELRGTVVATSAAARGYAVALPGGELAAVHAAKLPVPGSKLAVEATPLPNNTFAEEERDRDGTARQAILRGVVTHVRTAPDAPAYVVSGRGASILVHADPGAEPPTLGVQATVMAAIVAVPPSEAEPRGPVRTRLHQRELVTEAEPATYLDLAGRVVAHDAEARQLRISADWTGASEAELSLTVPERFDLAALRPRAPVVATATLAPDGSLTLAGIAGDAGRKGAAAIETAQGDLARR